ncbi:MAG: valine--tRNA ligase [archaeon]
MDPSKHYNAKEAEKKWRDTWDKDKTYAFDPKSNAPIYSIDTPPPTVSGKMHIGHAFSYSQMDFVARYKRMRGYNLFYPFGTDDNGLPTERLIEKMKKVKSTRMERADFVKLCLETLEKELRPQYIEDWKRIGTSADFNVTYTTINEHCQKIAQKSFLDLHKINRVYRKRSPFMWCPECQTAIAQVEMKDEERESKFVYFKMDTTEGKPITIATTRPELLPACVAVFVHPNDKRYKEFVGKKAILPLGFDREVEIYANKDADPEFGTGAVYHCTFGDMDDVQWVEDFGITPIEILNKDGTLNEKAGQYKGLKMKEARDAITQDLEKDGRLEKAEPMKHVVNTHDKCGTDLEILMTEQWFIRYMDLKADFLGAGGEMNWFPAYMKHRYDNWIDGLKWDWCISRQRHFGVPLPVWYCKKCGESIIADESQLPVDPLKDKPKQKCKCGSSDFEPEKDVFDTWMTSSHTPQIAAGLYPELFDKLFPMSLRPQAHDIITFWLFNTVVKSKLYYNKPPWKDIMISGWALDPKGKKMSKSKGNVVEPQATIEKYSADALRFWAAGSTLGEDMPFQEKDLQTGMKFATKLFNASKFVQMHLEGYKPTGEEKLRVVDKWILAKLNDIVQESTDFFEKYEYSKTKMNVENFFWHILCDNYLEIVKDRLYNPDKYPEGKEGAQYTLYHVLLSCLKMMAPIMPFITEEIFSWSYAKREKEKSIHTSKWPEVKEEWIDAEAKEAGELLLQVVAGVRQAKQEKSISLGAEVKTVTIEGNKKLLGLLELDIKGTARAEEVVIKEGEGLKVSLDA